MFLNTGKFYKSIHLCFILLFSFYLLQPLKFSALASSPVVKINPTAINIQDKCGNTPLHYAVRNNHLEPARKLLQLGANVNAKNSKGETPLHLASYQGNLPMVKLLVSSKALIDAKTNHNITPLCQAISFTKMEQVQAKLEIANYLIAHGANVNAKIGTHNGTPLFIAIQNADGLTEYVVLLIKAGANVNIKDNNGNTPIYWAASGANKTLEVLIKAGANVNVENNKGETPLANARLFEDSPSFFPDIIKNIELLKAAGAKE